jgi:DNA-binding HxlR family transcriptional regulator
MGTATNKSHILDGHVCPRFHAAIELVGRRWTGAVILTLMGKPRRFGEILEAVPDLHDRLLSERLKQLESAGLVERRVYPETPVRIEYGLTQKGRDLERALSEVERWAHRWIPAHARREDT